jgi:hypothetical protein
LELEQLAGEPESQNIRSELNRLLALRVSSFSTGTAYDDPRDYCRTLTAAQNFLYMVPELAEYLRLHADPEVHGALTEYERVVPYWFVSRVPVTFGEGIVHPLYDSFAIFQAKAEIQGESRDELAKYLDVPAFQVGDLFYIEKLIYLIEAEGE